jgi:hypothetical protein
MFFFVSFVPSCATKNGCCYFKPFSKSAAECLDIFHASEPISDCGEALFKDETVRKTWFEGTRMLLLRRGFEGVNELLSRLLSDEIFDDEQKDEVCSLQAYLGNSRGRLFAGRAIGSGVVEGRAGDRNTLGNFHKPRQIFCAPSHDGVCKNLAGFYSSLFRGNAASDPSVGQRPTDGISFGITFSFVFHPDGAMRILVGALPYERVFCPVGGEFRRCRLCR